MNSTQPAATAAEPMPIPREAKMSVRLDAKYANKIIIIISSQDKLPKTDSPPPDRLSSAIEASLAEYKVTELEISMAQSNTPTQIIPVLNALTLAFNNHTKKNELFVSRIDWNLGGIINDSKELSDSIGTFLGSLQSCLHDLTLRTPFKTPANNPLLAYTSQSFKKFIEESKILKTVTLEIQDELKFATELVSALGTTKFVTKLSVATCKASQACHNFIKGIPLAENTNTLAFFQALTRAFTKNPATLQELILQDLVKDEPTEKALAEALAQQTSLRCLSLPSNILTQGYSAEMACRLPGYTQNTRNLDSLSLSGCALAYNMPDYNQLRFSPVNLGNLSSLSLAGTNLDDAHAKLLAGELKGLRTLDVARNKLGISGITALLTNGKSLTQLNANSNPSLLDHSNPLMCTYRKKFSASLSEHPSLTWLDLSYCGIRENTASEIFPNILKNNTTLTRLDLFRNLDITEKAELALIKALENNKTMCQLHFNLPDSGHRDGRAASITVATTATQMVTANKNILSFGTNYCVAVKCVKSAPNFPIYANKYANKEERASIADAKAHPEKIDIAAPLLRNAHTQLRVRSNTGLMSVLLAFVRANKDSQFKYSILPFLMHINHMTRFLPADLHTVPNEKDKSIVVPFINFTSFSRCTFFQAVLSEDAKSTAAAKPAAPASGTTAAAPHRRRSKRLRDQSSSSPLKKSF